jgi:hypothetical protein
LKKPTLDKYFKGKYTSGMKCELLNEKSVTEQLKVQIKLGMKGYRQNG